MAEIDLATITIPTPEPYDAEHPHQQRENCGYVLLQMLQQAKTAEAAFELGSASANLGLDLLAIASAVQSLQFNSQVIDLGPFKIEFHGKTISLIV